MIKSLGQCQRVKVDLLIMNAKRKQELVQGVNRYGYINLKPLPELRTLWADLAPEAAIVEHRRLMDLILTPLLEISEAVTLLDPNDAAGVKNCPGAEKVGKNTWRTLLAPEARGFATQQFFETVLTGPTSRGAALVECEYERFKKTAIIDQLYDPTIVTNLAAYSGTSFLRRAKLVAQENSDTLVVGLFGNGFRSMAFFVSKHNLSDLATQACERAKLSLNLYQTDPP